jgi:hypothetical protein
VGSDFAEEKFESPATSLNLTVVIDDIKIDICLRRTIAKLANKFLYRNQNK